MAAGFTTFDDVTYHGTAESGKAIQVTVEGRMVWIPAFAIHDDSEIYVNSKHSTGTLVIKTDIAEEKGLVDVSSKGTGVGIPLKRNRLPDPPDLMDDQSIDGIAGRLLASSASTMGWEVEEDAVYLTGAQKHCIAVFAGERTVRDATFTAHAPKDIHSLLGENARLRSWIDKALKTQQRTLKK